jgi:hypothetical protein
MRSRGKATCLLRTIETEEIRGEGERRAREEGAGVGEAGEEGVAGACLTGETGVLALGEDSRGCSQQRLQFCSSSWLCFPATL